VPKKFIRSFNYAKAGGEHAHRTQRNIGIHLVAALLVLAAAIWLKVSLLELALLVITITGVIVTEMVNTALEVLVDHLTPEFREEAGLVKNVAAGAVLLAAAGAVVVGCLIFLPRLIK
jgi:diacylglycerol kinase